MHFQIVLAPGGIGAFPAVPFHLLIIEIGLLPLTSLMDL